MIVVDGDISIKQQQQQQNKNNKKRLTAIYKRKLKKVICTHCCSEFLGSAQCHDSTCWECRLETQRINKLERIVRQEEKIIRI